MSKRSREDVFNHSHQNKRLKWNEADRLSPLSDEILIRVFSCIPVNDLIVCQRVSRRINTICSDSQLWKAAYYNRFVRPRAARLPGVKRSNDALKYLRHSSNVSRWLEDEYLVKEGRDTDWKRQYKVRHNWSLGSCKVSEIQVADKPSVPPLLVRLHNNVLYTADSTSGLRAWTSREEKKLVATNPLQQHKRNEHTSVSAAPTAMAVNQYDDAYGQTNIAIGFQNGSVSLYSLDAGHRKFNNRHSQVVTPKEAISAIAFHGPYLIALSESNLLSIYEFPSYPKRTPSSRILNPPRLLHSLRSHTASQPLSLSIRLSNEAVFVSVAYAFPTYFSGWTVGIQEMQMTLDGDLIESRLAVADQDRNSLREGNGYSIPSQETVRELDSPTKPSSISYSHPYLLLAHPDNTLSLFLVTSTSASLSISAGSRLWGHTSSVSGAHVGMKGKAVSVSARGDELRVWELEGGMSTPTNRKKMSTGELSVRIQPKDSRGSVEGLDMLSDAISKRGSGLGLALEQNRGDFFVMRGWVGFDEENVIVLRGANQGPQALVLYNFG